MFRATFRGTGATLAALALTASVAAPAAAAERVRAPQVRDPQVRSVELYRGTRQEAAAMRVALCVKNTGPLKATVTAQAVPAGQSPQGRCLTVTPPELPSSRRTAAPAADPARTRARVGVRDYNAGLRTMLEDANLGNVSVQVPICANKINNEHIIGISLPVGNSVSATCNNVPGSDLYRL
ncbi:hypothetical protein MUU72_24445 [Streptomyces sp. RS10V-4]|uniref:hypothetical protein n=1 Tax=Streptomyces rhizoryzae TaxID=2932493 RepID=UPI0020048982|nr:hypothetical protein [Streptomyces rhizoryzae]MCK7626218.1 hypothetical protein [Streptomyces rhizoryzae]